MPQITQPGRVGAAGWQPDLFAVTSLHRLAHTPCPCSSAFWVHFPPRSPSSPWLGQTAQWQAGARCFEGESHGGDTGLEGGDVGGHQKLPGGRGEPHPVLVPTPSLSCNP